MKFLKQLDKLSLFVAAICLYSAFNCAQKGDWFWFAITATCVLLNLRAALPQELRWPKRLF